MADWSNCMHRSRGKCMHCMDWRSCMDWCSCMVNRSSCMVDSWCNCMVDRSSCVVDSWCNMEGSGVLGDCHRMDGCGMVEGGCMVSNSMVGRGSMVSNSVVHGSSMVSNGMVGCSMVDNGMVRVSVSHHRWWDNVSVLIQDGFWEVGVEQGVCIETVERDSSAAVDCVPELAPGEDSIKIRKLESGLLT